MKFRSEYSPARRAIIEGGLIAAACAGFFIGGLGAASADTLGDVKQPFVVVLADDWVSDLRSNALSL